jgi:hypothetical protein
VAECGVVNAHEFLVEVELARSELAVLGEGDTIGFDDWRQSVGHQGGDGCILGDDESGSGCNNCCLAGARARWSARSSKNLCVSEVGRELVEHEKA